MIKRLSSVEQMMFLSCLFTAVLIAVRVYLSERLTYIFLIWNLILAVIPLLVSRVLKARKEMNINALILLFVWLIFFPNAPYIITDIFHFYERPPIPKWFDLLIIISAAWNGLIAGIISLMQVEAFLIKIVSKARLRLFVFFTLIISTFGIYIGRFLRFNSWDVIADSSSLASAVLSRIITPFVHPRTWGFSLLFACLLMLMYYTVKRLVESNRLLSIQHDGLTQSN